MAELNLSQIRIQNKNDTFNNWKLNNPILKSGEIGFENDTYRMKMGDGSSHWNDLPYTNYAAVTGLVVTYQDSNPTELCVLPENFYLNTVSVTINEAWDDNVLITIGTDDDQSWITDETCLDLTKPGYVFVFKMDEMLTEPTPIKVWIKGSRSSGKITVNIK